MGKADDTMALTAQLVSAYLRSNALSTQELTELIRFAYSGIENAANAQPEAPEQLLPAVSIRKSVTPEAITCLECGKQQKTLKRHLGSAHGLSVDQYRDKWNLPADYPMVAPEYAQHRSRLALEIGLGRKPKDVPMQVEVRPKKIAPAEAEIKKPVSTKLTLEKAAPVKPAPEKIIAEKVVTQKPAPEKAAPKETVKDDAAQEEAGKPQHHYPASRWSKPSN